jgi:hypothetical protein
MSSKMVKQVVKKTVCAAIKKGKAAAVADNLSWDGHAGRPHVCDIQQHYMDALVDELIKGRYSPFTRFDVVDQVLKWLCILSDYDEQMASLRTQAWELYEALKKLPLDRNWEEGISEELRELAAAHGQEVQS